jgi:NRPS condensation-like uncharacterized protein
VKNRENIPKRFPSQLVDRAMSYGDMLCEMMIQLELEFTEQLDADRLDRAVNLALDAEPILGCRFVHHWRKPHWERVAPDARRAFVLAQNELEFESFKVASANAYAAPQVRVCLWNPSDGAHLLIKVSHYVSDATGVKDIARTISSIYSRLSHNSHYLPEPNLNGSRGVWQVLRHVPKHHYAGLYFRFLIDDA